MEPANLRHHQQVFSSFVRLMTYLIIGVGVLLIGMAVFLL